MIEYLGITAEQLESRVLEIINDDCVAEEVGKRLAALLGLKTENGLYYLPRCVRTDAGLARGVLAALQLTY
jgi:hypothetical protein